MEQFITHKNRTLWDPVLVIAKQRGKSIELNIFFVAAVYHKFPSQ